MSRLKMDGKNGTNGTNEKEFATKDLAVGQATKDALNVEVRIFKT
jgi:hypothetical protein